MSLVKGRSHILAVAGAALLAAAQPAICATAPGVSPSQGGLQGVWRLSAAQEQLTPVGGGLPPFTTKGRQRYEANRAAAAKGDRSFDPVRTTCASPGQPRLMLTSEPFAIFVRPRVVSMVYKWNHVFRQIAVGTPLVNPVLGPNWWIFGSAQGHASARWEGDTLVVQTVGLKDGALLDAYITGSDKLTLTERLRLRGADILEDRITISDPDTFTRSWSAVLTYSRKPSSELPFAEDVCLDRLKAGQPALQ